MPRVRVGLNQGKIFLDESGDLNFSPTGTDYFVLTSVSAISPFPFTSALDDLKYDCLESGLNLQAFHCTEDKQHVRDRVFTIVGANLSSLRVDSLIVEKRKTGPSLREETRFYPEMLGYLLKYVLPGVPQPRTAITVITDRLPVQRKRRSVEKAVKGALAAMVPLSVTSYRILHHESKSHYGLQVADYCSWAIFRKWESKDMRSYNLIWPLRSEFNIFQSGTRYYY